MRTLWICYLMNKEFHAKLFNPVEFSSVCFGSFCFPHQGCKEQLYELLFPDLYQYVVCILQVPHDKWLIG